MDPDEIIDDNVYVCNGMVSPDGSIIMNEPRCNSPVPPKKSKKNKDEKFLETVTNNLNCITEKLSSTSRLLPPSTQNENFCNYIINKMNKIDDEEIRDETEEEIILIINKALKKCRDLKNK